MKSIKVILLTVIFTGAVISLFCAGVVVDSLDFIKQDSVKFHKDIKFVRFSDKVFSHSERMYLEPFYLSINNPIPEDAIIKYTLDSSLPNESNGFVYKEPIKIDSTTTINVFAYKEGYVGSRYYTAKFIITTQVKLPNFSLRDSLYQEKQELKLSCSTENAIIRYTLDGSIPTENSLIYKEPLELTLDSLYVITSKAYSAGKIPSDISQHTYRMTGQVRFTTDIFSLKDRYYTEQQELIIGSVYPVDAKIYYRVKGSNIEKEYKKPLELDLDTTYELEVYSKKKDWLDSPKHIRKYIITGQVEFRNEIFSPQDTLFTTPQNIYIDSLRSAIYPKDCRVYYTLDGSEPTDSSLVYTRPLFLSYDSKTLVRVKAYKDHWLPSEITNKLYYITGQVSFEGDIFITKPGLYPVTQYMMLSDNYYPLDAELHYTLDGTEPTELSPLYQRAVRLDSDCIYNVRIKSFRKYWDPSEELRGRFEITGRVSLGGNEFFPEGGIYHQAQEVQIIVATYPEDSLIRYTVDGTRPTESSIIYTDPIYIPIGSKPVTIKAKAFVKNWIPSRIMESHYQVTGNIVLKDNLFSLDSGLYKSQQKLYLNIPEIPEKVKLYYTTDGSTPSENSYEYVDGIDLLCNKNYDIRVIGIADNWISSEIKTAKYQITGKVSPPIISQENGNYDKHFNVDINHCDSDVIIRYTTDGEKPTETSLIYLDHLEIEDYSQYSIVKVRAFKENWEASDTVTRVYSVLPTPINVRSISDRKVTTLMWNTVSVPSIMNGCNIYREENNSGTFEKLNYNYLRPQSDTLFSYTDYDIKYFDSYRYYVTAVYNKRESSPSEIINVNEMNNSYTSSYISNESTIYPNPVKEQCTISLVLKKRHLNLSIRVYNYIGQRVCDIPIKGNVGKRVKVFWDLKNNQGKRVSRGSYFIRVKAQGGGIKIFKVSVL